MSDPRAEEYAGVRCRKDKKPFKSGLKVNTISGTTLNIHSGLIGFTFKEDDSVVNTEKVFLECSCPSCSHVSFIQYGKMSSMCEKCKSGVTFLPYR